MTCKILWLCSQIHMFQKVIRSKLNSRKTSGRATTQTHGWGEPKGSDVLPQRRPASPSPITTPPPQPKEKRRSRRIDGKDPPLQPPLESLLPIRGNPKKREASSPASLSADTTQNSAPLAKETCTAPDKSKKRKKPASKKPKRAPTPNEEEKDWFEEVLGEDPVLDDDDDSVCSESVWTDAHIRVAASNMVELNRGKTFDEITTAFLAWIDKYVCPPNRPNRYLHWYLVIRAALERESDSRLPKTCSNDIMKWAKARAKTLSSKKLYEPSQAERFRLSDMVALWAHLLNSGKPVRREAALYSAITFFTGARAIEVGKLWIEDLYESIQGNAIVMPIRESKTNVFKNIPERLTMFFPSNCPINFKALLYEILGAREEGKVFLHCRNRRILCYHYSRASKELGWARVPSGHSGRTSAITMGIAAGIPKLDLEIMYRWAPDSRMFHRYRALNMEESEIGAPALVAKALVDSLYNGPQGTAPPALSAVKTDFVSPEVGSRVLSDANWYARTVKELHSNHVAQQGIPLANAPKQRKGLPNRPNSSVESANPTGVSSSQDHMAPPTEFQSTVSIQDHTTVLTTLQTAQPPSSLPNRVGKPSPMETAKVSIVSNQQCTCCAKCRALRETSVASQSMESPTPTNSERRVLPDFIKRRMAYLNDDPFSRYLRSLASPMPLTPFFQ
ncbi:Oidioi.mRNA.OKI2018_I69.chr1.g2251.t1.cds [Oikopleura dioica]|uniref:Oidioi.mRNA.OKI2018_I69.chr1.g2251.t1.cds n=1 Tax=Oikopleura dioica TaxID=34765 RepID=A0ABN7SVX2_OIKDI|nr:Oidioi.mRNA.OKI2018_I69.chr1.g2251.t1.cds [Oikopleura dioica]